MKFTTYNIQYGRGLDGKIDLDRIARTVQDADVIALQEVERFFPRSGNTDQVEELAYRLNFHHWVYGAGVDIHADRLLPNNNIRHCRQQFGNMLLSRSPILTSRNHLLPKVASTGTPLSIQRSALEGVISIGGKKIRVYSIHLTHISAEVRLKQIKRILEIDRKAVREGGPISGVAKGTDFSKQSDASTLPRESILLGDFNFTPDSVEFSRIVGPMSDYGGRVVSPEGFVDAWVAVGNKSMSGVTAARGGKAVRMDYCFVRQTLSDKIRSTRIDSKADGSDHKPMSVVFNF